MKIEKTTILKIVTTTIAVLLFSGCAVVTGHKDSLNEFDKRILANDCNLEDIENRLKDGDDPLLWSIQGASLARNCKDYAKSNHYFDYAETIFKESVDTDNVLNDSLEVTGSITLNNNINDYEGNSYEKIMVNTYKGLNFASLGDFANARVEFNRALDRQRRAKEFFQKEIKEQNEKIAEEEREFKNDRKNQKQSFNSPTQVLNNKSTQDIIYNQYSSSFAQFIAYPDFVNPFTTYVSGLFFLLNNDSQKGRDLLKEALAMDPKNKQLSKDFILSDQMAKNNPSYKNKKYVWLIYENGNSIAIGENKIRVPLFLVSKQPYLAPITFPKLIERNNSHNYLTINGQKTVEVADMDRVIKTEFQKRYKLMISEIVLSNIFKAYLQYQLNSELGSLGGLAGAIFQRATDTADVRSWTALPKDFQVLRIRNLGKSVDIKNDKGVSIGKVDIPTNKNVIIYIRSEISKNNRIHKIVF